MSHIELEEPRGSSSATVCTVMFVDVVAFTSSGTTVVIGLRNNFYGL